MELKVLDRPVEQYHWVLNTWLTTPGLSANEVILIRSMQTALNRSLEDFNQLRHIALQPAFLGTLKSARDKAVAAGKLISWSEYAAET